MQLSVRTAACLKRLERGGCGREEGTMWVESHAAYEIFCNFTTLKNSCRIKSHFYLIVTSAPKHISQGACKDAFSMLSGQDRNSMVHYCRKQTEADNVFNFVNVGYLSLQLAIYKCGRTSGSKDLMQQSVWVSCRMIFFFFFLLTLSLSLRSCGWLPHIYKSLRMHAYILKQAGWVSLARLITFTSTRPVCSRQIITKHTLWGMIPLVCEVYSYHASTVTPHERVGCR